MTTFIVRVWLRLTRPRLSADLRYGQRILDRLDRQDADTGETGVLRLMARGAYESIDAQLADVTAGYPSAGPMGRWMILGVEAYVSRVLHRLHEQGRRECVRPNPCRGLRPCMDAAGPGEER